MPATPRLEIRGASKTFGSATVLDGVELTVLPGEVHGIIGQNGSGKSTLVKILTGYHAPDPGAQLLVDGHEVALPVVWRAAHAAGISVVHQDLGLLDHLTVAENICVGGYVTARYFPHISWQRQREVAREVLDRLQVTIDLSAPVGTLSAAARAEVAIARAMRDLVPGSGLVILDESTRALNHSDRDRLHKILRRVVDHGTSVLMVSHNLEEVLEVTDRVTVLKDGRLAGSGLPSAKTGEAELARLMLGADMTDVVVRRETADRPVAIRVTGLRGGRLEGPVEFTIGKGEIVGITGLPGNGFEEVPYLLSGARPAAGGVLCVGKDELDLKKAHVSTCIRAGVVLIPERRDRDGLAFELSLRDNISLPLLHRYGKRWFVGRRWQHVKAHEAISRLGIRPNVPTRLVKELSGGNQQKVLFAKWLNVGPRLMLLHEPTQAVDIAARQDLLRAVHAVAEGGVSVLLTGVDAGDLVSICDRILLYSGGSRLDEIHASVMDEVLDSVYSTNAAERPT